MELESLGIRNIENLGAWQNVKCAWRLNLIFKY
jgi:hypothetical protein